MELYNGLQLLIFSFLAACVARVYLQSVQPEKIFSKLFYYLEDRHMEFERKMTKGAFWFSPFGYCQICTSFWIGVLIAIPLTIFNSLGLLQAVFMPFVVATIIYNKWL